MYRLSITTITIALFLLTTPALSQPCSVEKDEYKGSSVVSCESASIEVIEQPGESIIDASIQVIVAAEENGTFASVNTFSDSWNFLGTETAYVLADGTRFELDVSRNDQEVMDGGVVGEQNLIHITDKAVRHIRKASDVRMKLGRAAFELSTLRTQLKAAEGMSP